MSNTYAPPATGDSIEYTKNGGTFIGLVKGITSFNNTKAPGWYLVAIQGQVLVPEGMDLSREGEIELVRPWEVKGGPTEDEFNRLREGK